MSNTHVGAHPMIPRFIRLFSVPIFLGWIAIVVIVNIAVPQLEVVGEAHAVSFAPRDAPSLQAMQRIGKTFQEFDSNSSAMVVLEGDQPLGDAAHKYYDGLIDKLEADKKHVQHIQDFWGDPLTASGAQSADGKAAYVQLYLAGNQGESLANESVQAVRTIIDNSSPPPGIKAYVTGPAPLDQRPAPRGRQEHQADHGDHHLRDLRDAAVRLPIHRHGAARLGDDVHRAGRRPGNRCGPWLLRPDRVVDVRGQPAHHAGNRRWNGLCDLPCRPLSRGAPERRGPRNRVLHDVSRHRPRHPGLGSDHRGCDVLPALHAAALLPNARHSAGDRHARRRRSGADHGARPADHLQSLRPVRSEAGDEDSRLAPGRHRRGALAWTHPRRVGGSGSGRSAGTSVVQAELQRPPLPPQGHPGQRGLRGGRPALPAGSDEPGDAARRNRP